MCKRPFFEMRASALLKAASAVLPFIGYDFAVIWQVAR